MSSSLYLGSQILKIILFEKQKKRNLVKISVAFMYEFFGRFENRWRTIKNPKMIFSNKKIDPLFLEYT